MVKRYSEIEKVNTLKKLHSLKRNGSVEVDGISIENVRDLCEILDVSSYSIYKWDKELVVKSEEEENELEKVMLEIHDFAKNGIDITETKQKHFNPEEKIVADNRLIIKSEIRYFGNLAGMLNIKGYGDMPLRQLQLAIGLKLVQRSKLA